MLKIGVTGAYGLVGWHARCRLFAEPGVEAIPAGREAFRDDAGLDVFVWRCDAILHFAGMNRGEDAEIERVNVGLAEALVAAMERTGRSPHLVFSSSTHIDRDTAYGRSKRAAAEIFARWADNRGGRFTNLVLPHVFGEQGRPFYNSVVSTFCYQLAKGERPRIDHDGQLELLHAQEVAELALTAIREGTRGAIRPSGRPIRVSAMLERAAHLAGCYSGGVIPELEDRFDLRLFNTYRSYLFPDFYPRRLEHPVDHAAVTNPPGADLGAR